MDIYCIGIRIYFSMQFSHLIPYITASHLILHIDANPDPDPAYHFDVDADPDPDPAYHFDAGADPDPIQLITLMRIRIRILPSNLMRIRINNTESSCAK